MRQKRDLHARKLGTYLSRNRYKTFSNEASRFKNGEASSSRPSSVHNILDVLKLSKHPLPKKYDEFYTNGRSQFHSRCILLCSYVINETTYHFWKENHDNPDAHAEVRALQAVAAKELHQKGSARLITFYLSYSPCGMCADSIISFLETRPSCKMFMYASCIYRHNKEREHRDGLRKLKACAGIQELNIFSGQEWQELAAICHVWFVPNDYLRNYFDDYWRKELNHILNTEETDLYPWKSLQKPPEAQYLEDGGDPTLIKFETQINIGGQSRRQARRQNRMKKYKTSSGLLIVFVAIFILCLWLSNAWSSNESPANIVNVTNTTEGYTTQITNVTGTTGYYTIQIANVTKTTEGYITQLLKHVILTTEGYAQQMENVTKATEGYKTQIINVTSTSTG